jgi:antitoxin component HigA of HigAB toxin-antitoxin module
MPKLTPAQMKAAVEAFKKKFTPGFYHGSPSNKIKAFDPAHNPSLDASYAKETNATFLSKDPSFANSFLPDGQLGEPYRTGATVYPVSANLGKHFDHETPEGLAAIKEYLSQQYPVTPNLSKKELKAVLTDRADEFNVLKRGAWDAVETPAFQDFLRNNKYDSFTTVEAGRKNVGIFEPQNIRGKFAEFNPEEAANPDFMKAEGGSIKGGKLGALAKLAKSVRHPHGQDARVAQALEEYLKGNISQEERIRIANQFLPIRQWKDLPPNYTDDEIRNALTSDKQAKALAPVPIGMRVGNRLDIPAYTQKGVYVDTTHDTANKPISYGRTGHLKDVQFSSSPDTFVRVGLGTKEQALTPLGAKIGTAKTPKALIKGIHQGTPDDEVRRMMEEMMKDPAYTQIGMDPRKHSQFYDKSTGMPVFSAEEKLQSGPLIIAPRRGLETTSWDDPRLDLSDFEGKKYQAGGKVAKKALEFARSVPFVHYSKASNISMLDPNMYGTGIKGAEAARLKDAPDIRPRSYIYTQAGGRQPEQGLGPHKYQGVAEDMYPLHEDPAGFSQMAKVKAIDPYMMQFGREVIDEQARLNELERLIKAAGYKGYASDDVGLLFDRTPVTKAD